LRANLATPGYGIPNHWQILLCASVPRWWGFLISVICVHQWQGVGLGWVGFQFPILALPAILAILKITF
jgi:hypothetical protein